MVEPDLGDDAFGGALADADDGVQAVPGLSERASTRSTPRSSWAIAPFRVVRALQRDPQQQGVMVRERLRRASRSAGSFLRAAVHRRTRSLQYCADPEQMLQRLGQWTRPGGSVVVLVDSLVALVLELLAAGKEVEALL